MITAHIYFSYRGLPDYPPTSPNVSSITLGCGWQAGLATLPCTHERTVPGYPRGGCFSFLGFDFRCVRCLQDKWRPRTTPQFKKRTGATPETQGDLPVAAGHLTRQNQPTCPPGSASRCEPWRKVIQVILDVGAVQGYSSPRICQCSSLHCAMSSSASSVNSNGCPSGTVSSMWR